MCSETLLRKGLIGKEDIREDRGDVGETNVLAVSLIHCMFY